MFQARRIFEELCPGEEFLPRAPNPEDIIYDDGENKEQKPSGFEPEVNTEEKSDTTTEDKDSIVSVEKVGEEDKPGDGDCDNTQQGKCEVTGGGEENMEGDGHTVNTEGESEVKPQF